MPKQNRRTFLSHTIAAGGALGLGASLPAHAELPPSVIPRPATTTLPVVGETSVFPVRRVYCLGRNYNAHVREMGQDPKKNQPLFFMKPTDAIMVGGGSFPYPPGTENLHHEVELVYAIGKGGTNIAEADALSHVYGYATGLDMTRRDLQRFASKAGLPWEIGKSFDYSAPCTALQPAAKIGHPQAGRIWLKVNGETRQDSDLSRLIWNTATGIAELSRFFELMPGDLVFTGTPAGVGPVVRGDVVAAGIANVGEITITVS